MISIAVRRFGFALMWVIPLLAFAYLQGRLNHYAALMEKYECKRAICDADFDGDGIAGKIFIDYQAPASNFDSWFVIEDSGRQLLREPRRSLDNSLQTHAAVISESSGSRLIIYDHIRDESSPRSLVFAYDGTGRMVEVQANKTDQEVLAALAVTDDTGTRTRWLVFQLLAKPALVCYLVVSATFVWYRRRKRSKERPVHHASAIK
jgi:hypothetical protein